MSSGDVVAAPLRLVGDAAPEPAAWEAIYREHVASLYRYVYARTGNRPDAEDVTSTTFLRAFPRLQSGASAPELRAYLRTTARTVIADLWRDRHGLVPELIDEQSLANPSARDEETIDVETLLGVLPPHYRQVLELRFLRGYSVKETAAAMGISVNNAKVMQLRALRLAAQGEVPSR